MHPYRHLALRHEQRLINNITPELEPGEIKFHSYFLPSLPAGPHVVKVKQNITVPDIKGRKNNPINARNIEQKFTVEAPRFNIPDTAVFSTYPPTGDQTPCKTLPHIVFNDPHFPWSRPASTENTGSDNYGQVPWVALIAFTADELELDAATSQSIFPSSLWKTDDFKRNEGLGYDIKTVNLLENFTKVPKLSPVMGGTDSIREKAQKTSVVFLQKELFTSLFCENGKGTTTKYKYLVHIRKVATEGMVSAIEGTTAIFSSAVCPRPGPLNTSEPTRVFVHLVSLEGVDRAKVGELGEKVAMVSLYSWTYTSLPATAWDVKDAMENLGNTLTVLRANDDAINPPGQKTKAETLEQIIKRRQTDGYTLTRYRTVTGEETAAMYRGPLVPKTVARPFQPGKFFQSNFGTDMSVLDPQLGLLDITYSSAWQLGRTLALGDQSFTAALARLRTAVHESSLESARQKVYRELGSYYSKEDLVASIEPLYQGLKNLNSGLHTTMATSVSTNRWMRSQSEKIDTTMASPHIMSQIYERAIETTMQMASSPNGGLYNYHTVPKNTDWAIVQNWILDKIHLQGVPAHYLIPDPTFLPEEALRFFYIDENWTDAMIDGCLSLANQLAEEIDVDYCRTAIKEQLNQYLSQPMTEVGYKQQMPKYGFLLKSQVLAKFPDLTVNPTFVPPVKSTAEPEPPKPPILIQRRLASDTMLVLFDRVPPELKSIRFTLPPHQQTFSIGNKVTADQLDITYKNIYTNPPAKREDRKDPESKTFYRDGSDKQTPIFDWSSRSMLVQNYVNATDGNMKKRLGDGYQEAQPTSTVLAIQLNQPIYTLDISTDPKDIPRFANMAVPSQFQFYYPPFPSHKFKPDALPRRSKQLIPRIQLNRAIKRTVYTPSIPPMVPVQLSTILPNPAPVYQPKFVLKLTARDSSRAVKDDYEKYWIPTRRKLPVDLIFSITCSPEDQKKYQWQLLRIEISVMRGDTKYIPPKDRPELATIDYYRPVLDKDYDYPAPTMLSNVRLNVIRSVGKENLFLTVVPRGKPLALTRCGDVSFLLPLVNIVKWDKGVFETYVSMKVFYVQNQGKPVDWIEDGMNFKMGPDELFPEKPGKQQVDCEFVCVN